MTAKTKKKPRTAPPTLHSERIANRGRISSSRSVWLVFHCITGDITLYATQDAAAKAVGSCIVEPPTPRCRIERYVPASMRRRTVKK